MTHELGPLPEPYCHAHAECDGEWPDMFTADQLRDYALAEVERAVKACASICDDVAGHYGADGGSVADHCSVRIMELLK